MNLIDFDAVFVAASDTIEPVASLLPSPVLVELILDGEERLTL